MLEFVLTVAVYLVGAISEYESNGSITKTIMYQDGNTTVCECSEK